MDPEIKASGSSGRREKLGIHRFGAELLRHRRRFGGIQPRTGCTLVGEIQISHFSECLSWWVGELQYCLLRQRAFLGWVLLRSSPVEETSAHLPDTAYGGSHESLLRCRAVLGSYLALRVVACFVIAIN